MEKNVVYADHGTLFVNKKKLLIHAKTWMNLKNMLNLGKKKANIKDHLHAV